MCAGVDMWCSLPACMACVIGVLYNASMDRRCCWRACCFSLYVRMCVRTGTSLWLVVLDGMTGWSFVDDCAVAAVLATACVVTGRAMQLVSVPHSILGFVFLVVVTRMCVCCSEV